MATVTPIYTNPRFTFNRAYLTGFVGSVGVTNLALLGNLVDFDYLFPNYHVSLYLKPNFWDWNSNRYTLDYIFDFSLSSVTLGGTPIDAGIGIRFYPMTTEPTWRIQVLATLPPLETQRCDLQGNPLYWRPRL